MEDKKKITLTIISVATLVVLVLSATFAYFRATTSSSGTTTKVTASAEEVGSIALTNPTPELHLNLSASDMAQDNLGVYYATDDENKSYDEEAIARDIAVATLSGGSATANYECTTTISVEVSENMASVLKEGDAYIQFGGALTNKVDLTKVSSEGYLATFKLDGTKVLSQSVSAVIGIENRNTDQSYIAGKNLGIEFSNSELSCQVVKSKPNLSNTIMALAGVEGSGVYHETGTTTVPGTYSVIPASESEWTSVTSTNSNTIVGSGNSWQFSCSETEFNEDLGEDICSQTTATATFVPKEAGDYKIELDNNANSNVVVSIDGNTVVTCEYGECQGTGELGYLTSENVITIREDFEGIDIPTFYVNFRFYRKSDDLDTTYDAGYRYKGETVNNYVTFNNETWRIIGVEEGSAIGLESGKYYTKIIRNESIMNGAYNDEAGVGSDLETALNNPYYNSEYWDTGMGAEYDFTTSGINDTARPLIVNAKWYRVDYENVSTTSQTYAYEKNGTFSSRYVGLMSPSDYGFGALECANVNLKEFNTCKSWLFNQSEWLWGQPIYDEQHIDADSYLSVDTDRSVSTQDGVNGSLPARPVVYLRSDVIITNDGTGEEGNKYEIALSE